MKIILILLVRAYQAVLAPVLGACCRYHPSCSEYFIGAVREWGALKGAWMGLCRIARCHPFGRAGLDPVPGKKPH